MPQYLIIAKYSDSGAAGAVKDGFAKRQEVASALAESLGGKVVSWSWLRSSNWDFTCVLDLPDSESVIALNLVSRPTGAFESVDVMEMLDSAQMDRIASRLNAARYQPPGSAT